MIIFETSKKSNERFKWIFYILIGIGILIWVLKYSEWHYISKFIISLPFVINIIFDLYYLKKFWKIITKVIFKDEKITLVYSDGNEKKINYDKLKFSIRKIKFEKEKTEIEIKIKNKTKSKTYQRLHISHWNNLSEIENQLESRDVERVPWKSKTLWTKYWGIFIDLIFFIIGGDTPLLSSHQEETKSENTLNPIDEEK
jgi:hypothetical protein